jgi:sortase B
MTNGVKIMKTFLRVLWRGLLVILCGVFLGVFIFAAYQLYHTFHGYRQAEKEYDNLSAQYVSTPTPEASQTPTPTPEATQAPTPTPEVASGPIQVDFAALQARNNEVIGWIYSPNTKINYPVVKGVDNDFYLSHTFDGTANANGSIFMDANCDTDLSMHNTILYGHHMNDGSMFASLTDYRQTGYLEAHPVLYYYTPNQNYMLEVFCCFVTGPDSDVYSFNFSSNEEFERYLESWRSRSNFDTDVQVTGDDHIMTLSTCTYEYEDARYVVMCKIIPM